MKPIYFGLVTVPGAASRHGRALVVLPDHAECMRLLEAITAAGHTATGVSDLETTRAMLGVMRFDLAIVDRVFAVRLWRELMRAVGADRMRLALVGPDSVETLVVEGVHTLQRPLLVQQVVGAVSGAIATHPRLSETEPEVPVASA